MALITSSSGRPGGSWVTTYTPYDRLPEVKDKADRESATHLCLCRLCRSSLPFVSSNCPLHFVSALCLSSVHSAFRLCPLPFVSAFAVRLFPLPFAAFPQCNSVAFLCLSLRFHGADCAVFSLPGRVADDTLLRSCAPRGHPKSTYCAWVFVSEPLSCAPPLFSSPSSPLFSSLRAPKINLPRLGRFCPSRDADLEFPGDAGAVQLDGVRGYVNGDRCAPPRTPHQVTLRSHQNTQAR